MSEREREKAKEIVIKANLPRILGCVRNMARIS